MERIFFGVLLIGCYAVALVVLWVFRGGAWAWVALRELVARPVPVPMLAPPAAVALLQSEGEEGTSPEASEMQNERAKERVRT